MAGGMKPAIPNVGAAIAGGVKPAGKDAKKAHPQDQQLGKGFANGGLANNQAHPAGRVGAMLVSAPQVGKR